MLGWKKRMLIRILFVLAKVVSGPIYDKELHTLETHILYSTKESDGE